MSIILILLVTALILTLIHGGTGKIPLWPAVLIVIIADLISRYGVH